MTMAAPYWLFFILWVIFGVWWNRADIKNDNFSGLLITTLLFFLGWKVFGFIIQG